MCTKAGNTNKHAKEHNEENDTCIYTLFFKHDVRMKIICNTTITVLLFYKEKCEPKQGVQIYMQAKQKKKNNKQMMHAYTCRSLKFEEGMNITTC